jgi:hypothetical protein
VKIKCGISGGRACTNVHILHNVAIHVQYVVVVYCSYESTDTCRYSYDMYDMTKISIQEIEAPPTALLDCMGTLVIVYDYPNPRFPVLYPRWQPRQCRNLDGASAAHLCLPKTQMPGAGSGGR